MANDKGIPWNLPTDRKYFGDKTATGTILMGYGTYLEFETPFHGHTNYVATSAHTQLKPGFEPVADVQKFLQDAKKSQEDVWNIGGAGLLATTLDYVDELYLTQLEGDFHCTKFLPEFKNTFTLVSESEPHTENGITYRFQIWRHK